MAFLELALCRGFSSPTMPMESSIQRPLSPLPPSFPGVPPPAAEAEAAAADPEVGGRVVRMEAGERPLGGSSIAPPGRPAPDITAWCRLARREGRAPLPSGEEAAAADATVTAEARPPLVGVPDRVTSSTVPDGNEEEEGPSEDGTRAPPPLPPALIGVPLALLPLSLPLLPLALLVPSSSLLERCGACCCCCITSRPDTAYGAAEAVDKDADEITPGGGAASDRWLPPFPTRGE